MIDLNTPIAKQIISGIFGKTKRRGSAISTSCPEKRHTLYFNPDGTLEQEPCPCLVEHIRNAEKAAATSQVTKQAKLDTPQSVCLADVKPEPIRWLWRGWFAFGKLSLLYGDPGLGKTALAMDLAARASAGVPMPFCETNQAPVNVLILTSEDGLSDTLQPRLSAAGADMNRVFAYKPEDLPDLTDIEMIRREIKRRQARLVIVDPLMGFMPVRLDSHKDQHVRQMLRPLAEVADATHACIALLHHPNKSIGSALHRSGGSIGIAGACRSVISVTKHPDDPNRRVMCSVKCNVARQPQSIVYALHASHDDEPPTVQWLEVSDFTADSIIEPQGQAGRTDTKLATAIEFLRDILADGPRLTTDVEEAAKRKGLSTRTLDNARRAAGIRPNKRSGRSWLSLPDQERTDDHDSCAVASLRPCAQENDSAISNLKIRTQGRKDARTQDDSKLRSTETDFDWEEAGTA